MPANLCLVMHAAKRDAREFATQRARDRTTQRGFADSWRSNQAEDLPLALTNLLATRAGALLAQLAHGQELDDTLFN